MANYVLEILDGDRAGEVLPVGEQSIRIGRKPGNDVVLADEKTSGVHCEIVREGDRHVLRDLGSTNGTFLDGKRVTELVLTPGDVVTVGRLRVKFRAEAEAGDAGDMAVHRLDAARLGKKRGGSMGLVAVLVLVAAGGGGWYWWQGQNAQRGEGAVSNRRPVLQVAGDKVGAAGSCEDEQGWALAAAGVGFTTSSAAHTGRGGLSAMRGEAADGPDFAMATLAEPLAVFAGRTFTVAAHLQTRGGALAGLRCLLFTNGDAQPFRFRQGTPLVAHDGWTRVEVPVTVPQGCDRLQVEVVAVLGSAEAGVDVDDVAVTEGGNAAVVDLELSESKQRVLGTGATFAVRSTDADNPAILLEVLPGDVPPALSQLAAARLLALSDVGGKVAVQADERSCQLTAEGVAALEFVFPGDAAGNLMGFDVAGAPAPGQFSSVAAESTFAAGGVLLGDRATRALLRLQQPVECRGKLGNGLYRLRVAATQVDLVMGFRAERQEASDLLRQAREQAVAKEPGAALDLLRKLVQTAPQDSQVLGQAQELRTQLLTGQADALAAIGKDLEEAEFFDTRGGFERVVAGLDELRARYFEHNLEGRETMDDYRARATARLQVLLAAERSAEKQRLQALSQAFGAAQQDALAKLVTEYLNR